MDAAAEIVRARGVRGLNIAEVLDRCQLGTRAFYRNFESKGQLVSEVFGLAAATEAGRLAGKMKASANPIQAVVAWIDGRLDLAFDDRVGSELRQVSREAQTLMFTSPELVQAAFGIMLRPLIEQLTRGMNSGVFHDIDPAFDAEMLQGVVWACTERQWMAQDGSRIQVRDGAVRACLRALGVAPEAIAEVLTANRPGVTT